MILIQKRFSDDAPWVYWDEQLTVEYAIDTVKGYALGDDSRFRVVEVTEDGTLIEAFVWGPFRSVVTE